MIYIFLFYTKGEGKPLKWTIGKYKHVEMITYDGQNLIAWGLGNQGLSYRGLHNWPKRKFITKLWNIKKPQAMVIVKRQNAKIMPWRPLLIRACHELYRYMANLDIPWSLSPTGFYKNLLEYNSHRNYTILEHWERDHGQVGRFRPAQ